MQVWTVASGKAAVMASGKPFSPSTTAIRANLHPQSVKDHNGIHPVQRTALPVPNLVQHRIGDPADQVRRDLQPIDILKMDLNIAHRQTGGIKPVRQRS